MSITDELRSSVANYPFRDNRDFALFEDIADRIDAEHERACAEAYGNGVMSVPIALDESAWVELPKDADGVPIRIGDVMEWPDGKTFEVVGIGDGVLFYAEDEDGLADWTGASTKRHHHAPTVEDVLQEFADQYAFYKGIEKGVHPDLKAHEEVLRQYAAKLRLADE